MTETYAPSHYGGRTFDYVPRLDERNLRFLARDHVTAEGDLWKKTRHWHPGPTLDQGAEGSCVGHSIVQDFLSSPVRGKVDARGERARAEAGHRLAVNVYRRAKEIDEWEGVNYEGTSNRAGFLVARELGWIGGFLWSKNVEEARLLLEEGPLIAGVKWFEGMYETDEDGNVVVSGRQVGWHSIEIDGWSITRQRFRWHNSWGNGYGLTGFGWITPQQLHDLSFAVGGEVGAATLRRLQ